MLFRMVEILHSLFNSFCLYVHRKISSFSKKFLPLFDAKFLNGQRSEPIHDKQKVAQLKRHLFPWDALITQQFGPFLIMSGTI